MKTRVKMSYYCKIEEGGSMAAERGAEQQLYASSRKGLHYSLNE